MENVNRVNNLSNGLRKIVRENMPKPGQTIWFTSVRPNARGTTVLPYDRIYDPFAKDEAGEDDSVDGFIDIAYITGRDPGKGTALPKDQYGRIQFNKASGGRMGLKGGNRADEILFEFLFLTNQLRNNGPSKENPEGARWFVRGKQAVCYMEQPEKTADQKLEDNRKIRQAGNAIDEMPEEKLRDFASGLDIKGITKMSSANEIRVKLLQIASTPAGAGRILTLDRDAALAVKIVIKAAERAGIIVKDTALSAWLWKDGGDTLCVIPSGAKAYEALINYLLNKGAESYKMIQNLLKAHEEKLGQKPADDDKKPKKK